MKNVLISFVLFAGIGTGVLLVVEMSSHYAAKNVINLEKLVPLSQVQAHSRSGFLRQNSQKIFRVAVASMMSPVANINAYKPFAKYLQLALHTPVEIIQKRTYVNVNNLLVKGKVDLAFICTGAYIYGRLKNKVKIIAVPVVNGKETYRSYIIVHEPSKIKTIRDLQGKVFALTETLSNTGYEYPLHFFKKNGINPKTYFKRIIFTYNHTDSIKAVAEGIADGAAVDSIIYRRVRDNNRGVSSHTKIIFKSPPFPIPPVVMPDSISRKLREKVKKILLSMAKNYQGRIILKKIGVDGFVVPDTNKYK